MQINSLMSLIRRRYAPNPITRIYLHRLLGERYFGLMLMTEFIPNITLARDYLKAHGSAKPDAVRKYFAENERFVSKQSVNSSLNQLVERGEATKAWDGTYRFKKKAIHLPCHRQNRHAA